VRKKVYPSVSEISTWYLRARLFRVGFSDLLAIHLAHRNQLSVSFSFVTDTSCVYCNDRNASLSSLNSERASPLIIIPLAQV
jgi:hypothetical protein